ncbi:MAG: 3-deoxy-8-phosphooctulonate synthase [Cytophagales bacterium]|nr:3-deoxy-8-phosphooctulonate synthase [Cytophagales bacterium]
MQTINDSAAEQLYKLICASKVFLIAGPCVAESEDLLMQVSEYLTQYSTQRNVVYIFKTSFDKANRTSLSSGRGLGLEKTMLIFEKIKNKYKIPITTDIHEAYQAQEVAAMVDVLQIPAFLCRQTDLLLAAGHTGKIVNIKKAQFMSGADMHMPAQKVASTGNHKIMLCERGNMYGYHQLVVDYTNIVEMKKAGYPVIMDCTHAVQQPGGMGTATGGNREYVPYLANAAAAVGVHGYFFEVHPNPDKAMSDGANMLRLNDFATVFDRVLEHHYLSLKY